VDDRALADIAALADGTLPETRRAEVEARVAESQQLREALEHQRAALAAVRALEADDPPPRLLAWVRALGPAVPRKEGLLQRLRDARAPAAAEEEPANRPAEPIRAAVGSRLGAPLRRRDPATAEGGGPRHAGALFGRSARRITPRALLIVAAANAVIALVALAVVLAIGDDDPPRVADMSALAGRPSDDPAPGRVAGTPNLDVEVDGLAWPDWRRVAGWRATGMRRDEVGGRETATVFYARRRSRVAYSIVERPALGLPEGRRATRGGTTYVLTTFDGRRAVVWHRAGRTCVISGRGLPHRSLLRLAGYEAAAGGDDGARRGRYERASASRARAL
jgi:hypothetical protein